VSSVRSTKVTLVLQHASIRIVAGTAKPEWMETWRELRQMLIPDAWGTKTATHPASVSSSLPLQRSTHRPVFFSVLLVRPTISGLKIWRSVDLSKPNFFCHISLKIFSKIPPPWLFIRSVNNIQTNLRNPAWRSSTVRASKLRGKQLLTPGN